MDTCIQIFSLYFKFSGLPKYHFSSTELRPLMTCILVIKTGYPEQCIAIFKLSYYTLMVNSWHELHNVGSTSFNYKIVLRNGGAHHRPGNCVGDSLIIIHLLKSGLVKKRFPTSSQEYHYEKHLCSQTAFSDAEFRFTNQVWCQVVMQYVAKYMLMIPYCCDIWPSSITH